MSSPQETFAELIAALGRSDNTFEWAAALARALVALGQTASPVPKTKRHFDGIKDARKEFRRLLRAEEHLGASAVLDADQRKALIATLRRKGNAIGGAAAAHELLFAIDQELGPTLADAARSAERLVVGPGQVAPVWPIDLRSLLGRGTFLSHPWRKASGLGRLENVCVLPPTGKYRVTFDFRFPSLFGPFLEEPIVGVAIPNIGSFEESFGYAPQLKKERFFDVAPKDEAAQRRRILALLDLADRHGARLVLLPELSTSPAIVEDIDAWLSGPRRRVATVIAGSYHGHARSTRYNRVPVLGLGAAGAGLHHDKFSAYDHRIGKDAFLHEDIDPVAVEIEVFVSRGQTLGVLICKDLVSEELAPVLNALRLNFLAVVALSPETASFRGAAVGFAQAAQTITVMANFPGRKPGRESAALAVLPVAGRGTFEYAAKKLSKPSMLLMDLRKRQLGWRRFGLPARPH